MSTKEASGSKSDVECPTCGRGFSTERGMKVHHKREHGESIAGIKTECSHCGETFRTARHRVENYNDNFCKRACKTAFQLGRKTGEDNPNWSPRVTTACAYCGDELKRLEWRMEYAENQFCNGKCQGRWMAENQRGSAHYLWNRVEVECATCGAELLRRPSIADKCERHFCRDSDCREQWQSENMTGELNHEWKERTTRYYGPNWEEQAAKARERDNHTCQGCGRGTEQLSRNHPVHHITPRSEYLDEDGVLDYERANRSDNLVTLCSACHGRYEGIPLRPQLAD